MANVISDETIDYVGILRQSLNLVMKKKKKLKKTWKKCSII